MALARQLAQYDYEQRRKQHQSMLRQQHITNGQILHALEQNLAVIEAKARELRSKGVHDKELDLLLREARWKRDQARAAALAGIEQGRAFDVHPHAEHQQHSQHSQHSQQQPKLVAEPTAPRLALVEPKLEPQQPHQRGDDDNDDDDNRGRFSASPEPLSTSATDSNERTTAEAQPTTTLTLRSLLRAGLSRLPTPHLGVVDSSDLSLPSRSASPLGTVVRAARRLSAPLASPRPIIATPAAQPSPAYAQSSGPLRQAHPRRRNERLAVLCQRDCWKNDADTSICMNGLCNKPFTLLERRHHCRRCGDIFCAACVSHFEPLMDTSNSPWFWPPQAIVDALFPEEPMSPLAQALSCSPASSFASGSGTSQGSHSETLTSIRKAPSTSLEYFGTEIPLPLDPRHLRDIVANTTVERVCVECHALIHGLESPWNLHQAQRVKEMDEQYRRENFSELDMSPEQWKEKMRLCLEKRARHESRRQRESREPVDSKPSSVRSYSALPPVEEIPEHPLQYPSRKSAVQRRSTEPELPQLPAVGRLTRQSSVRSAPDSSPVLPHLPVRNVPAPLSVYSNEPPNSEKEAQHRRQQRHAREAERRAKRIRQGRAPVCYDSDEDALAEEVECTTKGKIYKPETQVQREERLKEEELRWRDFMREVDIHKYGRELVDSRGFCKQELEVVWGQGVYVRDEDLQGEWARLDTGEIVPLTSKMRRMELRAYRAGVVQRLEAEAKAEAEEAAKWPAFMFERKLAKFVPKDKDESRLAPTSSGSKLSRSASAIY